jgi:hypothetical protein
LRRPQPALRSGVTHPPLAGGGPSTGAAANAV